MLREPRCGRRAPLPARSHSPPQRRRVQGSFLASRVTGFSLRDGLRLVILCVLPPASRELPPRECSPLLCLRHLSVTGGGLSPRVEETAVTQCTLLIRLIGKNLSSFPTLSINVNTQLSQPPLPVTCSATAFIYVSLP